MRNFGVEIELIGLSTSQATDALTDAGIEVYNAGYTHSVSRTTWKVVTDGSVGSRGCEVVSPILVGEDGVAQVKRVMNALAGAGAGVNRACGLHVHIDAHGLSAPEILTIVARYGRYEMEIDAFMPPSRRGFANSYCQPVANLRLRGSTPREAARSMRGRYYKVNLQSFIKYGTIEFRQHSGTTDAHKAVNWIKFLQAFVEESVSLSPSPSETGPRVSPRINRTLQKIVDFFQENPHAYLEPTQIMSAVLNDSISESSTKSALSALKRAGFRVTRTGRPGRYFYNVSGSAASTPVMITPARPDGGLWAGIPQEIRDFYEARALTLRGA